MAERDTPEREVPAGAYELTLAGTEAVLLPERALWLPAFKALLVADLHWGKAAAFRAANIPVPTGTTAADLARLSIALRRTGASHLVVLGDLLHARAGRHVDTLATIAAWRRTESALTISLVRGNHDARAGDPPVELGVDCTDELVLGPFVGVHIPRAHPGGYVLGGHYHPHVVLSGRAQSSVRLPCFVFGESVGILPAFSGFTGKGMYERNDSDAIYAIAGETVLAVPARRTR
jgi:DNA ligase-associated metallophosphoesterase